MKLPTILYLRWSRSAGVQVRGREGATDLKVVLLPSLRRGWKHSSSLIHRGAYSSRNLAKISPVPKSGHAKTAHQDCKRNLRHLPVVQGHEKIIR